MFLVIDQYCQSPVLGTFLTVAKRVMTIIQIFVPILLIIWGGISIFHMVQNPEDKKGLKKVINKFIAAVIVFFIPIIVNAVMGMVGEDNSFKACWDNANERITPNSSSTGDNRDRTNSFITDPSEYKR